MKHRQNKKQGQTQRDSRHRVHRREPRVKDRLHSLEVRPVKSRGQNFLIDPGVIEAILEFGNPSVGDALVEIGPGLGALTQPLAALSNLTVIEIEPRFCEELKKRLPQVTIINADVRTVDFGALGKDLVVFGNLPYSLSTEIVFHLTRHAGAIKRAVLLLQREFAERMAAGPGGRDYGVLSISCSMLADMRLGPIIPGSSFHPPAGVESRLIELSFLPEPRFKIENRVWFEKVVRAAFSQRRKKLHNSLMSAGLFSREAMEAALANAGVSPDCRAETLSVEEFVRLADELAVARIKFSDR